MTKRSKTRSGSFAFIHEVSPDGLRYRITPQHDEWRDAMRAADDGDKSVLVALMKSGQPMPKEIVRHIGDLIDRWDWKLPEGKGRRRAPSYEPSHADSALSLADFLVNHLLDSGKSLPDAVKEVAAHFAAHLPEDGVKETVLREYHAKRRSPDRRDKKRGYDAAYNAKRRAKANKCT
jgi:hypothetical protein